LDDDGNHEMSPRDRSRTGVDRRAPSSLLVAAALLGAGLWLVSAEVGQNTEWAFSLSLHWWVTVLLSLAYGFWGRSDLKEVVGAFASLQLVTLFIVGYRRGGGTDDDGLWVVLLFPMLITIAAGYGIAVVMRRLRDRQSTKELR
jgi:hypothetical protein